MYIRNQPGRIGRNGRTHRANPAVLQQFKHIKNHSLPVIVCAKPHSVHVQVICGSTGNVLTCVFDVLFMILN